MEYFDSDYEVQVENLPARVECAPSTVPQNADLAVANTKKYLKEYTLVFQLIEKQMVVAEDSVQNAKDSVDEANAYEPKWYKIGSTRKKTNMLSRAQVDLQTAMANQQLLINLMFKCQGKLAQFCGALFTAVMQDHKALNDLTDILTEMLDNKEETEIPAVVVEQVEELYNKVEHQKEVLKEREPSKNNIIIYMGVALAVLACAVVYLMFFK